MINETLKQLQDIQGRLFEMQKGLRTQTLKMLSAIPDGAEKEAMKHFNSRLQQAQTIDEFKALEKDILNYIHGDH